MNGARAHDLVVSRRGEARFYGRRLPCAVGRSGFFQEKREGDRASPIGAFHLEFGLYRPDRIHPPGGALPWAPIRPGDGWSDDPEDPAYNLPVRRPHPWRHERLWRADPLYDLVVVFDANRTPIRPGCGSALFLHVWRRPRFPTEGCIAFARDDLAWVLYRWRKDSRLRLVV